ncbi:MAG: hypothetical protein QOI89_3818 [Solirubrobacteraceae bacterium]|nr:hypothetical protein [Solirubrobacteraceae bacterium]
MYASLCQKNLAANTLWSPMFLMPAHLLPIKTSLKGTQSGILLEITVVQLCETVELRQKMSLTMKLCRGIIVSHTDKHTVPSNTSWRRLMGLKRTPLPSFLTIVTSSSDLILRPIHVLNFMKRPTLFRLCSLP